VFKSLAWAVSSQAICKNRRDILQTFFLLHLTTHHKKTEAQRLTQKLIVTVGKENILTSLVAKFMVSPLTNKRLIKEKHNFI
jgi:hypothetical protein